MTPKPGALVSLVHPILSTKKVGMYHEVISGNQPIMFIGAESDSNKYYRYTFLVNEEVLQTHWITTKRQELFKSHLKVLT